MSTIHPHWLATDDNAPVPVRVVEKKPAPAAEPKQLKTVSRRPAAVVGILLALTIGAVGYGTIDDGSPPLPATLSQDQMADSYLEMLAGQLAEQSISDSIASEEEVALTTVPRHRLQGSIPTNVNTAGTTPSVVGAPLPVNERAVTADVTERMHSGAPSPMRQPETGAEMLIAAIIGAIGMLWLLSQRMLKTVFE